MAVAFKAVDSTCEIGWCKSFANFAEPTRAREQEIGLVKHFVRDVRLRNPASCEMHQTQTFVHLKTSFCTVRARLRYLLLG